MKKDNYSTNSGVKWVSMPIALIFVFLFTGPILAKLDKPVYAYALQNYGGIIADITAFTLPVFVVVFIFVLTKSLVSMLMTFGLVKLMTRFF